MSTAAVHRRDLASPASHDELDTQEQLLRDIAALDEVETCSSLVLQELLEHKPSIHPLPPFAARAEPEKQKSISLQQAFYLQQVGHHHPHQITRSQHHRQPTSSTASSHAQVHPSDPANSHHISNPLTQMRDAQHSSPRGRCLQHPVRHAEVHPPFQSYHQHQPADDSPATLLYQVLDCSTTGLRSGSSLDCFSKGMTLPALRSEPVASKRNSVPAMKKNKMASLRRTAEKSSTLSAEFSPPKQDTVGTSKHGKNPENPTCGQAKKGISGNHFVTERQRREFLNEKYQVLRSLIPNPTKADRASIVQDAIDYVNELKEYADKLRSERGLANLKRRKVLDGGLDTVTDVGDAGSCKGGQHFANTSKGDQEGKDAYKLSHKKSRYGTEVDVRVLKDEATIKVIQYQSRRSLLFDAVSMLNEADLELLHANGGKIGNCYAYMLNVKIHESSATHAGKIARQLLERIDASLEQTPSARESVVQGV